MRSGSILTQAKASIISQYEIRQTLALSKLRWFHHHSLLEHWTKLILKTLEVLANSWALENDFLALQQHSSVVDLILIILPVGPHDMGHLEIAHSHVIATEPSGLVFTKLVIDIHNYSFALLHIIFHRCVISLAESCWASKRSPLAVKIVESGIDFPGLLWISWVVS